MDFNFKVLHGRTFLLCPDLLYCVPICSLVAASRMVNIRDFERLDKMTTQTFVVIV